MKVWEVLKRQWRREALIHIRQRQSILNSSLLFSMILAFFPLTMPAEPLLLRTIAPGLIWIALLFTMLLSSERLFQQDYEDGILEQWLLSGYPVSILVFAKITVHWLLNILPILLLSPGLCLLFKFTMIEVSSMLFSLLFGSLGMFFLCALSAVFGVGFKQRSTLMTLIVLPLVLPIMIFGSSSAIVGISGATVQGYLAFLLAISLSATAFLPVVIAKVIEINLSN